MIILIRLRAFSILRTFLCSLRSRRWLAKAESRPICSSSSMIARSDIVSRLITSGLNWTLVGSFGLRGSWSDMEGIGFDSNE